MNSDNKKRRSFVALLFVAGYGGRSAANSTLLESETSP